MVCIMLLKKYMHYVKKKAIKVHSHSLDKILYSRSTNETFRLYILNNSEENFTEFLGKRREMFHS